jgi:hypothetical protein
MSPIGQKPVNAELGTYAMASVCETCAKPVLCLSWPLNSWRHVTNDDLALLAQISGDEAE